MSPRHQVPESKKQVARNLYMSDIAEEFIAMQLDLELPAVVEMLKEMHVYEGKKQEPRSYSHMPASSARRTLSA